MRRITASATCSPVRLEPETLMGIEPTSGTGALSRTMTVVVAACAGTSFTGPREGGCADREEEMTPPSAKCSLPVAAPYRTVPPKRRAVSSRIVFERARLASPSGM